MCAVVYNQSTPHKQVQQQPTHIQHTFLRTIHNNNHRIRAKFEKVIRSAQDSICAAISEIDGKPFHQDAWTREDGGGGITRVLNVSHTDTPLIIITLNE